ncbi:MAG TPA: hypothetical protein VIJ34_12105 [Acidimicrobiales bacterium]
MTTGLFDTESDLPAVVRGLPPEDREQLTFHLPLEVQALEVAGAPYELIVDRIEQRLPVAFAASLVDPPLFRWAEKHYRSTGAALLSEDADTRHAAFAQVSALGAGLAGGAFHPLIRLGYGALRHDAHEMTRGLAYLRVRRQVLFDRPPLTARVSEVTIPSPAELAGTSVFDQLDFVAGEQALLVGDEAEQTPLSPAELCERAMALVLREPSSFIAIHTVTGLHALVEFDSLLTGRRDLAELPGDPLLKQWWRALAEAILVAEVIVGSQSADSQHGEIREYQSAETLIRASIESAEVHDLKISVSLGRLVELGVAPLRTALNVGSAKLAATKASA